MTEGAIKSRGVSFSHGGRRMERLRGSRSTITGWAVAVAISRARLSRLQELVGRFLKVARRLGHILVLDELAHLIVDRAGEVRGRRRAVRRAGYERVRLELGDERLGDDIEATGGHVGPGGDRALLRIEGGLTLLRTTDFQPADGIVAIARSLGKPEGIAYDHVLALGSGRWHHAEIGVRDPVLGREVTLGPVTHDVKHRGPGDQSVVGLVPING